MRTYEVRCRREGAWWVVTVPEVRGAVTQAKRLDQVEGMVRDAIAGVLDVDPESFVIDVRPELDERRAALLAEIRHASERAEQARRHAERAAAEVADDVAALLDSGLTVRDVGRLLGISPQRVSQLARRHARNHAA